MANVSPESREPVCRLEALQRNFLDFLAIRAFKLTLSLFADPPLLLRHKTGVLCPTHVCV